MARNRTGFGEYWNPTRPRIRRRLASSQETHHGDTYAYGYDKTGQLTSVRTNGALSESFGYDANGNRTASTGPNGSQTYAPPGTGNRLLNDGLFRYTYDGEGNLKTKTEIATGKVTEYTWDFRNRLTKVEERSAGGIVLSVSEYAYDPTGRRILQKTNGNALYTVYDRDHAWADRTGAGAVAARYLLGDRIDAILARWKPGAGTAWHLTDKLGTVRDLVGAAGAIINHLDYAAFGQILAQTNPAAGDRYAFTGREWEDTSGDYYYRVRYYAAAIGRFLQIDPLGFEAGDVNLYRYVLNAPSRFTDPSGTALVESRQTEEQPRRITPAAANIILQCVGTASLALAVTLTAVGHPELAKPFYSAANAIVRIEERRRSSRCKAVAASVRSIDQP